MSSWKDIRVQVLKRDHHSCRSCGKLSSSQVHHLIPRKKGGADEISNLVTLCGKCHMLISPVQDEVICKVWNIPKRDLNQLREKIENSLLSITPEFNKGVHNDSDSLLMDLKNKSYKVRKEAVIALGAKCGKESIDIISSVLDDKSPYVRRAAVFALGEIEDPTILKPLKIALNDDDNSVRRGVATSLGKLGNQESIDIIQILIQDENSLVRETAVRVLGNIGGKDVIGSLEKAVQDEDIMVSMAAKTVLDNMEIRTPPKTTPPKTTPPKTTPPKTTPSIEIESIEDDPNNTVSSQEFEEYISKDKKLECECGSSEFIEDDIHLELHCKKCGLVIEENIDFHIARPYKPPVEHLGGYSRKIGYDP